MPNFKTSLLATVLVVTSLSACNVPGLSGAPPAAMTQTQGGQMATTAQAGAAVKTDGNPTPVNGSSANKVAAGILVNTDSMVILAKKSQQAQATVTYLDGTKDSNVAWSSSDGTVVAVNPTTGVISGIAPGVATVQAKVASDTSKFANITVTVRPGAVEDAAASVTPSNPTVAVGATVQLSATILNTAGKNTANGTWSSSNSTVVKVGGDGIAVGIKPGTATITFTSDLDATVKATTTVTVTDPSAVTAPVASPAVSTR